jgi:hypothetical protein
MRIAVLTAAIATFLGVGLQSTPVSADDFGWPNDFTVFVVTQDDCDDCDEMWNRVKTVYDAKTGTSDEYPFGVGYVNSSSYPQVLSEIGAPAAPALVFAGMNDAFLLLTGSQPNSVVKNQLLVATDLYWTIQLGLQDDDVDEDGIPDAKDLDIDGDGISNKKDADIDGDGIPNQNDLDMDGDGIVNGWDADTDGDGRPNTRDSDDDNDGIKDWNDPTREGPMWMDS